MSQSKTTRAFRTISEAGEELDLQPHVLRFWESKFSQIKPIKRGGGRRFYRPEDIEFLRGIKTLLHDEKHPIKDVQKLIQKKGPVRIMELGRSVEKAAREKTVAETDLLPQRVKSRRPTKPQPKPVQPKPVQPEAVVPMTPEVAPVAQPATPAPTGPSQSDRQSLEAALERLQSLKGRWSDFRESGEG